MEELLHDLHIDTMQAIYEFFNERPRSFIDELDIPDLIQELRDRGFRARFHKGFLELNIKQNKRSSRTYCQECP